VRAHRSSRRSCGKDFLNGLVGAAARLLDRTGKRDSRLNDVRSILERHLPSVGLDVKENEKTGP
jgi:hypothetical protein